MAAPAVLCTDLCPLCLMNYNKSDKKQIMLPCNHCFCITCLFRLKMLESCKCLHCKEDWSQFDLFGSISPSSLSTARASTPKIRRAIICNLEDELNVNPIGLCCKHHNFPVEYWCNTLRHYWCKKCVVLYQNTMGFELLEDSFERIKADADARFVQMKIECKRLISKLESDNEEILMQQKILAESKLEIEKKEFITIKKLHGVDSTLSVMREFQNNLYTVKEEMDQTCINDVADLIFYREKVLSSESQLQEVLNDEAERSQSDLLSEQSEIIQSQVTSQASTQTQSHLMQDDLIFGRLFLDGCGVFASIRGEAEVTASKFIDGEIWLINETNYLGAILALLTRQPEVIHLTVSLAGGEAAFPLLAIETIAKRLKKSSVSLLFYDTYLHPATKFDGKRLQFFLDNQSLKICLFRGHLENKDMTKLLSRTADMKIALEKEGGALDIEDGVLDHESVALEHLSRTLDHQSGTLDHQSGTLDHQSGTLDHQSGTLDHQSGTLENESRTQDDESGALDNTDNDIEDLGLGITCRDDVTAVNNNIMHNECIQISLSVSLAVDPASLCCLQLEQNTTLVFHAVADEDVHLIRPLVDALKPCGRLWGLRFPSCQLTRKGAAALTESLTGLRVVIVSLDLKGQWAPCSQEKSIVSDLFIKAVKDCCVQYDFCGAWI